MKSVRLLSCLLGIFASAAVASAQTIPLINETFDDSGSASWGSSTTTVGQVYTNGVSPAGGFSAGTSTGALTITGGRMDLTATVAAQNPAQVQIARAWTSTVPSTSDWSISVDATNTFTAASGQAVQIGLFISNTAGLAWNPPVTHDYVKLVLRSNYVLGSPALSLHGGLHLDGTAIAVMNNPKSVMGITPTTGTLVFSYVASTKVITAGYNFNGTIYEFGSYGVAGSGGSTANADWLMSGGTFTISLFGQAEGTSTVTGYSLSSGTAYLDNFITSSSTTAMTAVPEPSTYAALAGLCSLGIAFWRRRSRA